MELETAVKLIEGGVQRDTIQTWADLGAGSGLFTNALSTLLAPGSSIIAVDRKPSKITVANGINLQMKTGDFITTPPGNTDGVLMANALHFVKEKESFLGALKTSRLVLVEYDTDTPNQWVPYPVSFAKLRSIYPNAQQIGHAQSAYQRGGMYSALLLF